jgi:hypothetical protein
MTLFLSISSHLLVTIYVYKYDDLVKSLNLSS